MTQTYAKLSKGWIVYCKSIVFGWTYELICEEKKVVSTGQLQINRPSDTFGWTKLTLSSVGKDSSYILCLAPSTLTSHMGTGPSHGGETGDAFFCLVRCPETCLQLVFCISIGKNSSYYFSSPPLSPPLVTARRLGMHVSI